MMSVGNITRFTEATRVQMPGLVHLMVLGNRIHLSCQIVFLI